MHNSHREAPRNARAVTCVAVGRNEPLRSELEAFVNAAFLRKHGAHVRSFMPTLLSWKVGGAPLGVVGLRAAQEEALYLENYLDSPIERMLAGRAGRQVPRARIVEIGHLASRNWGRSVEEHRRPLWLADRLHVPRRRVSPQGGKRLNPETLVRETAREREFLLSAPVIRRCLAGDVDRELYIRFLTQAYQHVRHTVPLLAATAERLPSQHAWLQEAIAHYIVEEEGHDAWILDDIAEAGGDRAAALASEPAIPTAAMVAFAWDTVLRGNPVGFFGMVHVLEGTSVALAIRAAEAIHAATGLPSRAFTYLRSHGELDKEHVGHLSSILERFTAVEDCAAVTRCARGIYWLYGHVFWALETDDRGVVETDASIRRYA